MADIKTFTPGPWTVFKTKNGQTIIHTRGLELAIILKRDPNTGEEIPYKTNAELMASAPDLLATCETALKKLEDLARINSRQDIKQGEIQLPVNVGNLLRIIAEIKEGLPS